MSEFVFKQFTVKQEKNAMKIGTDAVLLGCLAEWNHQPETILDIGTGTGILSLMMAQRCDAHIDAVEYEPEAATEALYNITQSKWAHRIHIHQQRIQDYTKTCPVKYDLIVSNPPYYPKQHNTNITNSARSTARHDEELSFSELVNCMVELLKPEGFCWVILPAQEAENFLQEASNVSLHLIKKTNLLPKANKTCNRVIMQLSLNKPQQISESNFIIYNLDNSPSLAYKQASHLFYTGKQFQL